MPAMSSRRPARPGDLDGVGGALVRVDPAEEEQVVPRLAMQREGIDIDAVVDRCGVVQCGVAIGVADGNVGGCRVVALVDGDDPARREAVDRRHDRCVDEAAVGEGKEVETVVDDVEVAGVFEHLGDVHALGDLGIDVRIL